MPVLSASILSADFLSLGDQARAALKGGADWIHVDVMDGHFVPNISIGIPLVAALRRLCDETGARLDVHLMIHEPDRFVDDFASAGADVLTVHAEACTHLHRTLEHIRSLDVVAGVALNPGTPPAAIQEVTSLVELVLVMTVNPGFAGQVFIPESIDKIRRVRSLLDDAGIKAHVEADGGVKQENVARVVEAGADVIVAATALFQDDITEHVAAFRRAMDSARAS